MSDLQTIRDDILTHALPAVPFDGWRLCVLAQGAAAAGYEPEMAKAVFPAGVPDALAHFSDMVDRRMLAALAGRNAQDLRVRDRIRAAVLSRFDVLADVREAETLALRYWSVPMRSLRAAKLVWRTADRIWDFAGDRSTDYNHYTKRGLLAGVLAAATLAWLQDPQSVPAFVDRRLENVMQLGGVLGKIRPESKHARA